MLKSVRTPDEIMYDLSKINHTKKNLEKELEVSLMMHNEDSYSKYIGKWVLCDAYESGFCYVYVLGVGGSPEDDLHFYGYGIDYDAQSQQLQIVSKDYPCNFYVHYPDNIKEISPKHIKEDLFDFLKLELEEELDIEYED